VLGPVVITLDGVDAPAAVTATAGHTLEETPKAMTRSEMDWLLMEMCNEGIKSVSR
jgi:hypothetical protein